MFRVIVMLLCLPAAAVATEPDPLFQSDEILDITLRGPFKRIMEARSVEEEDAGQLVYTNDAGETVTLDIKLRSRGKYRRKDSICEFSPLRLNLQKSAVEDTLFHKQDKLKLVTHCVARETRYAQGVIREYLVYRMLNILTEQSFRVRLLRVTYEETEAKLRPEIEYGFLIEHKDRLGKRLDLEPVEGVGKIKTREVEQAHLAIGSVFQYMIGNTDFSPVSSSEEQDCCHNHSLFMAADGQYVSIPYDFDMTGFVNAEYARPNPRFGLRTVKARLYRGRCWHNDLMPDTLQRFRDERETFTALIETQPQLEKTIRNSLLRYMNDFYKTIDSPKKVESRLIKRCLGSSRVAADPVTDDLRQSRVDVVAD